MRPHTLARFLALLLAVAIAACGAPGIDPGTSSSKEETALLLGRSGWSLVGPGTRARVTKVDGVPVDDGTRVELAPGRHVLEVHAGDAIGDNVREVTYDFEAGNRYLLALSSDRGDYVRIVPDGRR